MEQMRKLGSLSSLTVQPAPKKRHDTALNKLFDFLKFENIPLPTQKYQMNALLCEYTEHWWSTGEGRALASDMIAGIQDFEPHLKGCLPTVWRLLKVWGQNRAPPMLESVVHAAGRAILNNDPLFALSILLGFYGMMRTGELIGLSPREVEVSSEDSPAIIALGMTKSGERQGAAESITISVFNVVRRLKQWKTSGNVPLARTAGQCVHNLPRPCLS